MKLKISPKLEQEIRGKYGLMEEDRKFVTRTSSGSRDPLFPRMRNSKNQRFIKNLWAGFTLKRKGDFEA